MADPNSLSVVLPVHNAQHTLGRRIATLLDLLPELTARFEILILDDGSDDHTVELAHELQRIYPQVALTRHDRRRGGNAIIETALAHTTGEILFILDDDAPIDTTQLHQLWSLRSDVRMAAPPVAPSPPRPLIHRLAAWGFRIESSRGRRTGLQMLRRSNCRTDRSTIHHASHSSSSRPSAGAGKHERVDAVERLARLRAREYREIDHLL